LLKSFRVQKLFCGIGRQHAITPIEHTQSTHIEVQRSTVHHRSQRCPGVSHDIELGNPSTIIDVFFRQDRDIHVLSFDRYVYLIDVRSVYYFFSILNRFRLRA